MQVYLRERERGVSCWHDRALSGKEALETTEGTQSGGRRERNKGQRRVSESARLPLSFLPVLYMSIFTYAFTVHPSQRVSITVESKGR